MQQTANKNIQTYQIEVVTLIQHQILKTNLQGCVAARGELTIRSWELKGY